MELDINLQLDAEIGEILWVEFGPSVTDIILRFYYDNYKHTVSK